MHQFNNLAQYRSYHADTYEKKADLFRKWLIIQLQDRLVQSPNLSYNDLANAVIDEEGMMKACAEAKEKKMKMIMPRYSGSGGSSSAPLKYHMVYTPTVVLGQLPTVPIVVAAVAVQLCSFPTVVIGISEATIADSNHQLSMIQLQKDQPLCPRLSPGEAGQLTMSSSTCGQSTEGPIEGHSTTVWPHQLYHHGGDPHRRRSPGKYVLPQ
jgi:hypothetical protein